MLGNSTRNHVPAYWAALDRELDAKIDRSSMYLKHPGAIGTIRENILRRLLAENTPKSFSLSSGFVCRPQGEYCSRQCDILVYDSLQGVALLDEPGLVVITPEMARVAIEVKSTLNQKAFNECLEFRSKFVPFTVTTMVVGLSGVRVERFRNYISRAFRDPKDLGCFPQCFLIWQPGRTWKPEPGRFSAENPETPKPGYVAFRADDYKKPCIFIAEFPYTSQALSVVFRLKWHTGEVRLAVSREMSP